MWSAHLAATENQMHFIFKCLFAAVNGKKGHGSATEELHTLNKNVDQSKIRLNTRIGAG
jgi:hypothetical protein